MNDLEEKQLAAAAGEEKVKTKLAEAEIAATDARRRLEAAVDEEENLKRQREDLAVAEAGLKAREALVSGLGKENNARLHAQEVRKLHPWQAGNASWHGFETEI